MKSVRFQTRVFGVDETVKTFGALGRGVHMGVIRGVRVWLEAVGAESQAEVPRKTGRLAGSMRIAVKQTTPVHGEIEYTAPYAAIVHEVPRGPLSNGKWKYLEDPFKRLEPQMTETVAREAAAAMKEAV
jgi:hypothetical protein